MSGKVRAIGVSNFRVDHLEQLLECCRVVPHVNQIEMHPLLRQQDIVGLCHKYGIQIVAYASLGVGELLSHPAPCMIAARVRRPVSQVLLRWAVQLGACVIPKASQDGHIDENSDIFSFELTDEDMATLGEMAMNPHRFCWDPSEIA